MKKISLVTLILLVTIIFNGCGIHTSTAESSNPSSSSPSVSSKSRQSNSSSMVEVNNSMEKLDGALNNSDNTKEINETETLINNIN